MLLEFPLGHGWYHVGGQCGRSRIQVGDRIDIILIQKLAAPFSAAMALQTVNVGAMVGATRSFTPGEPNYGYA